MINVAYDITVKVIAAVLGVIAGYLVKRFIPFGKSRGKIKYLTWTAHYVHPMAMFIDGFKMTFKDHECKGISETRVALWNESSKVAEGTAIAPDAPIVWRPIAGNMILSAKVIQQSHEGIGSVALIENDDNRVVMKFNYLEPKDGFIVSILHTGPRQRIFDPTPDVNGSIKGFGKLSRKLGDPSGYAFSFRNIFYVTPNWSRLRWLFLLTMANIGLVYGFSTYIFNPHSEIYNNIFTLLNFMFVMFGMVTFGLLSLIGLIQGKPPEELTAYGKWEPYKIKK